MHKFGIWTRLCEIPGEFLHVFQDENQKPRERTFKDGNSGLRKEISAEDVLRRLVTRGQLAELPNVKLWCLLFACAISAILTALCEDLGVYTCLTSWMENCPRVSIGDTFKERTFWNFRCIISQPMLTCIMCRCTDQVPRDLVRLYGA